MLSLYAHLRDRTGRRLTNAHQKLFIEPSLVEERGRVMGSRMGKEEKRTGVISGEARRHSGGWCGAGMFYP